MYISDIALSLKRAMLSHNYIWTRGTRPIQSKFAVDKKNYGFVSSFVKIH